MLVENDVDVIEFTCPRCGYRWCRPYELVHCELPSGEVRDYYSFNGMRVMSPYNPEGAPGCPTCARRGVATLSARYPRRSPKTAAVPRPDAPAA